MISSRVSLFLPACRTARPHRSSRLRGGRSPSISKLARLSARSSKLAARETRCAPVRPSVSAAFPASPLCVSSVNNSVRRMIGQNLPLPRRLSRMWRRERRGFPVKYASASRTCLAHNCFKRCDLGVRQFFEFAHPPPLGQLPFVLPYEHQKIFGQPVRHFYRIHDAPQRLVMPAKIVNFARQILLNCPLYASIEKLCCLRGVKIPIQIGSIVQHLHVSLRCWSPLDETH